MNIVSEKPPNKASPNLNSFATQIFFTIYPSTTLSSKLTTPADPSVTLF